jgi:hypothetical protein
VGTNLQRNAMAVYTNDLKRGSTPFNISNANF